MMERKIIYRILILFFVSGSFIAQAQQQTPPKAQQKEHIRIIPKRLEPEGINMKVEVIFDMSNLQIRSMESHTFTPVLAAGKKELELPKVIIKGARRFKADSRADKLNDTPPVIYARDQKGKITSPIYAMEKFNRHGTISYKVSVPYRDWMENASLNLREEVTGCCGAQEGNMVHKDVYNDVAPKYAIEPKFRFLTPDKEQEKRRSEIGKAYLDFPRGKSEIDPYFHDNRSELDKINQMIVMVATDLDATVNSVEMRGYASPESSEAYNYELSSKRAQAMREYFANMSTIPANLFRTGVGGEDWDGLKNLMADYRVSYKNDILNIINTVYDLDTREKKIRSLGNGQPYKQIFQDLYPKLRRVDCEISYTVRDFTLDEGKERIQNKPKLLSQNEMYQVARTYPEGSRDFNQTLMTARKFFPDSDIANLNGAAAALSEGDTELAEEYLYKVQNTNSPEYANCLGVFYMLTGNFEASEKYLRKAEAAGVPEAEHNLDELEKVRPQKQEVIQRRQSLEPE
jgi:outer membrane protein OmpA-like peptidoglycan-associated protein